MKNIKYLFVAVFLIIAFAGFSGCSRTELGQTQQDGLFYDKPYSIKLGSIQAFDPRPLKVENFVPDGRPEFQGLRIDSTGRIFPFAYIVIHASPEATGKSLFDISKVLESNPAVAMVAMNNNEELGDHIHFSERFMLDGKPHHISSNYIFIKEEVFYHIAVNSYAIQASNISAGNSPFKPKGWADGEVDPLAEEELGRLLRAMSFKGVSGAIGQEEMQ